MAMKKFCVTISHPNVAISNPNVQYNIPMYKGSHNVTTVPTMCFIRSQSLKIPMGLLQIFFFVQMKCILDLDSIGLKLTSYSIVQLLLLVGIERAIVERATISPNCRPSTMPSILGDAQIQFVFKVLTFKILFLWNGINFIIQHTRMHVEITLIDRMAYVTNLASVSPIISLEGNPITVTNTIRF